MAYQLVRLPFAGLANIRPGQLAGPKMVVDRDFVPFVHAADRVAGEAGVVVLVNSAFRRADMPVTDAVVPPATSSQHFVGRALDANLLAAGRVWGSGAGNPKLAITPTSSPEIGRFLDGMRRAGFRWGGVWTPPDRIHWDAWIDPRGAEYVAKYRLFQRLDLSALPLAPQGTATQPPPPPPTAAPQQEVPFPVVVPAQPEAAAQPGTPATAAPPAWLARDVQRQARWLPAEVRQLGFAGAYRQRWATLPGDVQATIAQMRIPTWMVALVPVDADKQAEILKQFRFMVALAGPPPPNPIAARAEQLLIFGGSAQLPTPGDSVTGASLGPEGCTAAMSKYVVGCLKVEFPRELAGLNEALTTSQLSSQMRDLFQQAARQEIVRYATKPFSSLQAADVLPGSLMIAQKPGGTHVFGWTRVPAGWRWDPSDKMAIGNTGLPQFGDRMILAQEYVTGAPNLPGEQDHNQHGPINSTRIIFVNGKPDPSDPRTNPYAVAGASFVMVNFLAPAPTS